MSRLSTVDDPLPAVSPKLIFSTYIIQNCELATCISGSKTSLEVVLTTITKLLKFLFNTKLLLTQTRTSSAVAAPKIFPPVNFSHM